MTFKTNTIGFLCLSSLLTACSERPPEPVRADLAQQCIAALDIDGSFQYSTGDAVPVVKPAPGGSQIDANAINVCISEKAAAAGIAAQNTPEGSLPLPTQYPLLDGDVELWSTLTRAQQERALVFLKNGGTIRSSLQGD